MQLLVKKKSLPMSKIRENFIQTINIENNSSQYFTLNDLTAISYEKKNNFSMFQLNINSLQYHFDQLQIFYTVLLIFKYWVFLSQD